MHFKKLSIFFSFRYIAAIHPFSLACQWFQTNGTKILLAVSWIIGALYANSLLESTDASSFTYGNNTYYECNYDNGLSRFKRRLFLWTNFVATFLLPAIILTFTYGRIMRHLVVPNHGTSCETSVETNNHHQQQQQQHHHHHHHHQHPVPQPQPSNSLHQHYHHHSHSHSHTTSSGGSNRTATIVLRDLSETPSIYYGSNVQCRIKLRRRSRTIRIILVVIIAYGVCWAPIKIFQLLIDHGIVWFCSEVGYFQFVYSYIACHWLSMANSCVNPIVYSYMSKSFRVCQFIIFDKLLNLIFFISHQFRMIYDRLYIRGRLHSRAYSTSFVRIVSMETITISHYNSGINYIYYMMIKI